MTRKECKVTQRAELKLFLIFSTFIDGSEMINEILTLKAPAKNCF